MVMAHTSVDDAVGIPPRRPRRQSMNMRFLGWISSTAARTALAVRRWIRREAEMIVERTMHAGWLSNTYLVADRPGGHAVLIDTGGPSEPILEKIAEHRLTVSHVLCTHHHADHIAH